ncbi:hypothetical protein TREPR_2012 [Treponema primitia ZAS-2]|uniref:Uncharacterized protein n=1 Tax=Treponema primitia (strain ATCC BAA-887 / DSM 12427 / ZAS-2) TaxID=545694 RepID=F5YJW8_TREPZ|nr:hypothetical protein [Treponema primitia]AEF85209.1 hypothetical protein TREPR_2012 [Treponema primitia ZAS-2]
MTDINKVIEEVQAVVMPFESWERLAGESAVAYAAFCAFRDFGPERNIRKAVEVSEKDETKQGKKYRVWRGWAAAFRWRERAADYDGYLDKLKQAELRKTIEEQGKVHRAVTGKMLQVVSKKLDLMDPADLAQGTVTEWVSTAIRAEREAAGITAGKDKPEGSVDKNGQITFLPEFEGL